MFTPWVCTNNHYLEIDQVTSKGLCKKCKSSVTCRTTPDEVRQAIQLDRFKPVRTVKINDRVHTLIERECEHCNRSYDTPFVNSKYCTDECKALKAKERDRRRRLGVINCMFCGKTVETVDKRVKFCGAGCRKSMRKA